MEERRKVYVEVRARHLIDGTCRPETIKFENDEVYEIDRVKQWKSKYRRTWRTTCLFIKPAR